MAIRSKIPLLLSAWILLRVYCQDGDPECTIYVRDHDHLQFDELFELEIGHSRGRHNASENRTLNKANKTKVLATENRSQPQRLQHRHTAIATNAEGISVAWQEGAYIFVRLFNHACRSRSATTVVVKSPALAMAGAASDLGTGLGDAVALSGGRVAISWSIDGDVWVKVVDYRNNSAAPVRVNAQGRHQRREITMTTTPDDNGFVLAWSTWGQDGDAWGIAARIFTADGTPVGDEQLLNVDGTGSQQRPQLFACKTGKNGPAVWATWRNGALDASREFSVRRLGARSWNLGPELKLDGSGPVSSVAMMCATGSSTQNPTVVWAAGEPGEEKTLGWTTLVEVEGRQLLSRTASVGLQADARQRQFLEQARTNTSKLKDDAKQLAAWFGNKTSQMVGAPNSKPRRKSSEITSLLLRAEGDVLAAAVNNDEGGLTVRLFDMSPVASYPIHQVAVVGAKLERLTYDVTMDQALITCFSHRYSITCERRHLQSLMEPEFEQVSWWFIVILFFVLFWLRHECFDDASRATTWSSTPSRSNVRKSASMLRRLHFEHAISQDLAGAIPQSAWRIRGKPRISSQSQF